MPDSFYYILFSVIFLSIFLAWVKSETLANPTTIYVIWWGGFIFLSTFNLIGMRLPSMYAYQLIILSLIMFSVGSITFLSNKKLLLKKVKKLDFNINNSIKLKLFFYFQFFITIILILMIQKTIGMLRNLNPGTFRGMVYSSEGLYGNYLLYFAYFVKPSLYACSFISIAGVLLEKLPKRFLFISFLNLILYSISTIGRFPIFLIVINLFLGFYFLIDKKKIKLRYIASVLLLITFIISMSTFRTSNQSLDPFSIIKNYFVWYFAGPFTAFDYFLNNYKVGIDYDYSYFRGFIAGIDWILDIIFKKISIPFANINNSFHEITATYRSLGGSAINHNSHYTMLYTFYRDAGIFGIALYSYIIGVINSLTFNTFRKNYSIVSFSLLLLVFFVSIMGLLKWEFRYIWSVGSVFIIIFISQKFVIRKKAIQNEF
ncbi:MAG: oligosaccharide repeat unit polymerase [Candidatus Delongbacteria bacterium]|nr:oligosaccharide repeat unit polymerase [Candidatus Delongbacteria bacterium]